jgi:hypothetical protein
MLAWETVQLIKEESFSPCTHARATQKTSEVLFERSPHTPKRKSVNQPSPLLSTQRPMPDKEQSGKRREPDGTTLTVEEWIELMNKHDRLEQYAKQRREETGDE